GRFPRVFDELYVNLVHVGETGGVLDSMLSRLSTYLEKAQALKHRVQMAIVYPILVMTIAVPLPTRIVIATSNGVVRYWYIILAVWAAGMYGFRAWYRTESGRLAVDRFFLRAPIFGPLVRK